MRAVKGGATIIELIVGALLGVVIGYFIRMWHELDQNADRVKTETDRNDRLER